jgi:hypothetical protein
MADNFLRRQPPILFRQTGFGEFICQSALLTIRCSVPKHQFLVARLLPCLGFSVRLLFSMCMSLRNLDV